MRYVFLALPDLTASPSLTEMVPDVDGSAVSTSASRPCSMSQVQPRSHITLYSPYDEGGYSSVTVRTRRYFSFGADSCFLSRVFPAALGHQSSHIGGVLDREQYYL